MCGTDIACVLTDGQLVRVRLSDATIERRLPLPRDTVDAQQTETAERLVGSPDGRTLAIVSLDGRLRAPRRSNRSAGARTAGCIPRPARAGVLTGREPDRRGDYASVLIWRTDGSGQPERHEVHGGRVVSAEWSADGHTLATLGRDGGVVLVDMTERRRVGAVLTDALDGRTTTVWATSHAIVVGQVTGQLLFVDPTRGTIVRANERPHGTSAIDSARVPESGNPLVTTDYLGGTAVWDLTTRRLLGTVVVPQQTGPYLPATWVSPDGQQAATIRGFEGPTIFDVATRQVLRQLGPLPLPLGERRSQCCRLDPGWTFDPDYPTADDHDLRPARRRRHQRRGQTAGSRRGRPCPLRRPPIRPAATSPSP